MIRFFQVVNKPFILDNSPVVSGLVGLSLSYALTLKESQVFWSRIFSMLSDHIISVERIKQFIDIPSEPPAIVEDNRPPSSWPSKGRIDLRALEVRGLINVGKGSGQGFLTTFASFYLMNRICLIALYY